MRGDARRRAPGCLVHTTSTLPAQQRTQAREDLALQAQACHTRDNLHRCETSRSSSRHLPTQGRHTPTCDGWFDSAAADCGENMQAGARGSYSITSCRLQKSTYPPTTAMLRNQARQSASCLKGCFQNRVCRPAQQGKQLHARSHSKSCQPTLMNHNTPSHQQ